VSFLQRQLEDPARRKRLVRWSLVALGLVLLAEVVLPHVFHGGHPHFGFEEWPAFGSLYGFASCVVIIVVSKGIGKAWLMRKEDKDDA
jgi:hypothetical protein